MKKETNNITALKSKMWITDSLLLLMETKDYNKISITEIINNTELTRQTFYRNFDSKEDVLCTYINKLYEECFNEINKAPCNNLKTILIIFFEYWLKHKDFFLLLKKSNFNYKIKDSYYLLMNKYFEELSTCLQFKSEIEKNYIKHFLLGGLIQVKINWVEQGFIESPKEISEFLLKCINPYICTGV